MGIKCQSNSLVKVIGCLQSLEIYHIKTLPKVFMENLPSTLTELRIWDCDELPELGSKNITALRSLRIAFCSGLTSVSDCLRHQTTLEDLSFHDCPELEFLPDDFQDLTSLRSLGIIGRLPQMTCLPEGLQQVAGTLEILGCSGLTSLPEWMDKFTSLRRLVILNSKNLKVLPEEVLHLTSLQDLTITDCHPDMHRRYAKETGEDWHKIAHIPELAIIETTEWKIRHGSGKRWMKCNMIPCFSSSSSSSSGTN